MARAGKGHAAPALRKTPCGHGEIKTIESDVIMNEVVKTPQQNAGAGLACQLMQGFGVDTVSHESRTDPMTRNIAQENAQKFLAVGKDHAEVTTNRARGTVVALDRDLVPNQAAWRE